MTLDDPAKPDPNMSLPSYILKMSYGVALQKNLQQYIEKSQAELPSRDSKMTELANLGVLGRCPGLTTHNTDDKEYLEQMLVWLDTHREDSVAKHGTKQNTTSHTQIVPGDSRAEEEDSSAAEMESSIMGMEAERETAGLAESGPPEDEPETSARDIDFRAVLGLPSRMEDTKNSTKLDVSRDGLELSTQGDRDNDEESRSVGFGASSSRGSGGYFNIRSNRYVTSETGVYYFEVTITSGVKNAADVSVGMMNAEGETSKKLIMISDIRGHDDHSWGYNGKEGELSQLCSVTSASRGTMIGDNKGKACSGFGSGDTIGFGVDFASDCLFISKNGVYIGEAFTGILPAVTQNAKMYPVVSLTRWNSVRVNFGLDKSRPFAFDIDGYVQSMQNSEYEKVDRSKAGKFTSPSGKTISGEIGVKQLTNEMVQTYLSQMGYADTLNAFQRDLVVENGPRAGASINSTELEVSVLRNQLKRLIMDDNVREALSLVDQKFPQVFEGEDGQIIRFSLECLELAILVKDQLVDQALALGNSLANRYSEARFRAHITEIVGLVAFSDPEKSASFRRYYTQQKQDIVDALVIAIDRSQSLPTSTCFERLVSMTKQRLSGKMYATNLINVDDYMRL